MDPRPEPPRRPALLRACAPLCAALLVLILSACGVATVDKTPTAAQSPQTPVEATATAATPASTATPDTAALLKDGGIAIIRTAFDRLMDEYIDPLDSSRILDGAWTLLAQEAGKEGLPLDAKPAFNDDREADFGLFRASYVRLTASAPDATQLRYATIRGMTQTLQDCHTYFLNPVAADTQNDTRAGKGAVGIGIELAGIPPLVTEVYSNGPAARAGMLVGDRITAVDDTNTAALGPSSAFDLLNGHEGTAVRVQVQRPDHDGVIDLSAVRERVTPPNVESRVIDGHIGYVRIRNFVDTGVASPLRDALTAFETQGVTGWIIDVRGDPGGRLDPDAMSLFVKDGVIVRDHGRDGKPEEDRANGAVLPIVRPTVLLTNNRTGSVAEVFAAALQEYHVAYVVGQNTNGCVGFTDVQPLGDGSSLAVTTYVNQGPVSNRALNGTGVAPDEPVARTQDDIANNRDPQLDAAVAHLG